MKTIAVASFKGGTAKTSSVLHIGAALATHYGHKVLVIDFDPQANLSIGLGFDPDSLDSLAPVLQGHKKIQEVIIHTSTNNLDLIPADSWLERLEVTEELAKDRYSHERLKQALTSLDYDTCLIDTPPSLCWLTESALIAAEHALICAAPEFYSVKGLERLAQFIETSSKRHPIDIVGVLLSFWNSRGKSNEAFLQVIEQTFPKAALKTRIRRDIQIVEASIFGKPIFETAPSSRAAEDYLLATEEILEKMGCKAVLQ
jgi:chromosome partitioning protein